MTWYFYNNRGILKQEGLEDPLPVGLVTAFVSDNSPSPIIPAGWLLCDGALQTSAVYPELSSILAYPAAPGATFNVPNLNTRFPVGAGIRPLKSIGGITQHPHTIANHTHSNTHRHVMVTGHSHIGDHKHRSGTHQHGSTNFSLAAETGSQRIADDTGAGLTLSAKGPGSGASHTHDITGVLASTTDVVADFMTTIDSDTNSVPVNSGTQAIPLQASASAAPTPVDKLPPYLNVYYIIKAVDFSGGYI